MATGVCGALEKDDVIIGNHRSHGHLLAKGADPNALMAEIFGKVTGCNKGKSGTLHLAVSGGKCSVHHYCCRWRHSHCCGNGFCPAV
ncbi:MAG: thiamine pyrophosphate-dependent enzyme [Candidatus Syntrophopropionicum ammoniitolerans]